MNNLEIINQLLNGYHLSKKELKRAEKILHGLNVAYKRRIK